MDFSEKLEHAEYLFCDEKFDESERKFEQLLNENTDEAGACQIVECWVNCLMKRYYELQDVNNYEEAIIPCKKSLDLLNTYADKFYDKLLCVRNDYSLIISELEMYDEAEAEYISLISECRFYYGGKNHDMYIAMGNLAEIYSDTGRIPAAIAMRSHAINGLRELHGKSHSDYIREMINLAFDYEYAGNYTKALALLEQAYELRKQKLGMNNAYTIDVIFHIAVYYKRIQQGEIAVRYFRLAASHIEKDDFTTLIHKVQYAICLSWIGEKKQAERIVSKVSDQLSLAEYGVDELKEYMEYAYSGIALYERNYAEAVLHAENAVSCIINNNSVRKVNAQEYVAVVLFYAGEYQRAYTILEQISDHYEKTECDVLDLLMYNYVHANVTAALGMFDKAEKSVFNAMTISRQCTFASASFLAYSADAFLALKQGNDSEFERLRMLAMSYAAVGMDEREFEVVWLKNL